MCSHHRCSDEASASPPPSTPPPAEEEADSPHASSLPLSDRLRSTLLIRYLAVALCAALLVTAVRDCLARYTAGETKATLADR